MNNWNEVDELEMVELYAAEQNKYFKGTFIESEEALSELFDETIAPEVLKVYGEDDQPAMDGEFNNWTDALCTDGIIHTSQRDGYCYVGKYSSD